MTMTALQGITWWVIVGVALFAVTYAFVLARLTRGRVTLTGLIDEWSERYLLIPIFYGVLMGHLFFEMLKGSD
jgi:hypothetical protein